MFGKLTFLIIACCTAAQAAEPAWLDLKPGSGPGNGKHIVFITGDEEKRQFTKHI